MSLCFFGYGCARTTGFLPQQWSWAHQDSSPYLLGSAAALPVRATFLLKHRSSGPVAAVEQEHRSLPTLTSEEPERVMLQLARAAGLPLPWQLCDPAGKDKDIIQFLTSANYLSAFLGAASDRLNLGTAAALGAAEIPEPVLNEWDPASAGEW